MHPRFFIFQSPKYQNLPTHFPSIGRWDSYIANAQFKPQRVRLKMTERWDSRPPEKIGKGPKAQHPETPRASPRLSLQRVSPGGIAPPERGPGNNHPEIMGPKAQAKEYDQPAANRCRMKPVNKDQQGAETQMNSCNSLAASRK